jgi:uncharacterized protein (UPF0297 family)
MATYIQVNESNIITGVFHKNARVDNYASDPSYIEITQDQYNELVTRQSVEDVKQYIDGVISDAPATVASEDDLREIIRRQRNKLLAASDWTQANDSPLSASKRTEWATYRQALRDLPANTTDPANPTWPTKPS